MTKSESRKAFEDWSEGEHYPFEISYRFAIDEDGDYKMDITQFEWEAWQAAINYESQKNKNDKLIESLDDDFFFTNIKSTFRKVKNLLK